MSYITVLIAIAFTFYFFRQLIKMRKGSGV